MPLEEYREKRAFDRTPEPAGAKDGASESERIAAEELHFVVQKHAARRLHYDFRLELDGVLKSWAVPKGPSLDPHEKRLAVHVEDHPIEYGSFEGVIPEGEYGAGTVMVWDRGTYVPKEDLAEGYAKGSVKIDLKGGKLSGGYALVRMRPRPGDHGDNWLLIKERDDAARPHDEYDVLTARPESVASGRDIEQIAGEHSAEQTPPDGGGTAPFGDGDPAVRGSLPADAPMQLATLVDRAPDGSEWLHEPKYDGYRLRCEFRDARARLLTRSGQDWTDRFEPIADAVRMLPVDSALFDGEIIATDPDGLPDFGLLQQALSDAAPERLTYMIFDLLYLEGWDLRNVPLRRRKELLAALVPPSDSAGAVRYVDHVLGGGPAFHRQACTLKLEGSVSKRADRPYVPGRTHDWLKVRCLHRQEFVVVGWTDPRGSRSGFGALLVAVHSPRGLHYAGRVGTGFTEQDLVRLRTRLDSITVEEPLLDAPIDARAKSVHWVRPSLVIEATFREWTRDGLLRHASFVGLREDKPAEEVVRERAHDASAETGGKQTGALVIGGVSITNPDKELLAGRANAAGITKADLARYYERIAPHVLPHLIGRPLTLVRCPHGHARDCFYQKHPEDRGFPASIRTLQIAGGEGPETYMHVDSLDGLLALVQLGTLEIHAWNSTVLRPVIPDRIVFDLDPGPGIEWKGVCDAALTVRDALEALGLAAFAKTTGGKGLHVVVPITPAYSFRDVRALARALVDRMAALAPDAFTAKMSLASRPGRVFIDYLRNARGATAVVAFSTRAKPGAPVSVPVSWEELAGDLDPAGFDILTVPSRLGSLTRDPWQNYESARASLHPVLWDTFGIAAPSPAEV